MSNVVVFENVCFSYGKHEVLHGVSFTVEANSFLGIVGPNGGGKTTLLRLALGLERPDKGKVSLFDKNPVESRSRTGYVMQHLRYDEKFPVTVFDVVLMGCTGKKTFGFFSKKEKSLAAQALDEVGMEGFEHQPFNSLSGGQRQRVLIAQALSGNPEMLILDEPTANIDIEGEEAINILLNNLSKRLTVVSVSHNINTVLRTVSHVLCVNKTTAMSRLDEMHPDTIARAAGGDLAVLHHELNCRVHGISHDNSCCKEHL
jgi:zinc transport system ATP-binding protein